MKYAVKTGLRYHDIDTEFHKDGFRHSKVDGGFTDIQTAWWSHKPTYIFSY
jgi:tRNA 2-selenouridine synthase SelU